MSSEIDDLPPPPSAQDFSGIDDLPPPGSAPADTRTTLQRLANIAWSGAYPKPIAPDLRSDEEKAAERDQYMKNLPSALAAGASMMLPVPGTALGRIAMAGATGGAVGGLEPAKDAGDRIDNATSGAALGVATGLGSEAVIGAGKAAISGGKWIAGKIGDAASKIGEAVTGVPEEEIKTYATAADKIKEMMNKSGGEIPQAADDLRQNLQDQIRARRQNLSSQVKSTLDAVGPDQNISVQPVIDKLGEIHATIDPNLHPETAAQVEELADRVASVANQDGNVSAGQMHDIKEMLQDSAKGAYIKNGQIFQPGKDTQQAAKGAAAVARKIVNDAVPDVAQANNQLSYLHKIEDSMNKNLLAPGKSEAALLSAGSGANPRNASMLQRLDAVAGTNSLQGAQQLAAAKTFNKPSLSPLGGTGKTLTHALRGGALGGLIGAAGASVAGLDPVAGAKYGAIAGGALTSPVALKAAIDAGRVPVQAVSKFAPSAIQALQSYPGAVAPLVASRMSPSPGADQTQAGVNRVPAKGPDAWAQSGLKVLGIQDRAFAQRLLQDPKAKQLLIQASDLKPGSKAMQKIMTQIQKGWSTQ